MKNKIIILIAALCVFTTGNTLAVAQDAITPSFSYVRTFRTSAYYSPLPCQDRYVTGSFSGDKRLNGNGTNGADGTPVYPGMVAAPGGVDGYEFGTKMQIPGIGTVGVHDRGGAIVKGDDESGRHDRLDIWMGYGDAGLNRALNWGKRDLEIVVYGVDDSIQESITLSNYSADEAVPNDCQVLEDDTVIVELATADSISVADPVDVVIESDYFKNSLSKGHSGSKVKKLQEELKTLNFYHAEFNGQYDEATEHAVFKFQQSQGIVVSQDDDGAGVFGPMTRERANELLATRNYTNILIAEASDQYSATLLAAEEKEALMEEEVPVIAYSPIRIEQELQYGVVAGEVVKLHEFLVSKGYYDSESESVSDRYSVATKSAVMEFQLANDIIQSPEDIGAGRVGPATLSFINGLS